MESLEQFSPDDLAITGAIVTVAHYGQLKIERGLVRKGNMKKKLPSPARRKERGN
jgi:ParB family transcriptional regulator, chromosome partitioning protein